MNQTPDRGAALRRALRLSPVFCALDAPDLAATTALARRLAGTVGGLKLGLEFFAAQGPGGVRAIAALGLPIFLDLKLHDIPNTVSGAIRALGPLGVSIVNVHAAGGEAMMRAAAQAARASGPDAPLIVAVTVLTSLDGSDLAATGIVEAPQTQTLRLARLARTAGLDGVVCGAGEAEAVRQACGPGFLIITPGIRPEGAAMGDQKRAATPAAARAAGADILVIGRPITEADDPAQAARRIAADLGGGG